MLLYLVPTRSPVGADRDLPLPVDRDPLLLAIGLSHPNLDGPMTPYEAEKHHRRSIRLKGYDYTQSGAYFVTIVTHQRECLFGELVEGEIISNAFGVAASDEWFRTAELRPNVQLFSDEMVAMPNHIHGILWIAGMEMDVGRGTATLRPYETPHVVPDSLGAIVRVFKSAVTYRINGMRDTRGSNVWQRNYYDHIIGNEGELINIWNYIDTNPLIGWKINCTPRHHPVSLPPVGR